MMTGRRFLSGWPSGRSGALAVSLITVPPCPVCGGDGQLLDVVDFNKTCEEIRGVFLPIVGVPIYYALCAECGFCFAPQMYEWSLSEFSAHIYNEDYKLVDPDYEIARPSANANFIASLFGKDAGRIRHLDYGGGNGALSGLLRAQGFASTSYDPFVDLTVDPRSLGKFDLITAFEVFEHVPDVAALMSNLAALRAKEGVILFTTLASDGNIGPNQRLNWWYASPRNGHISLFSRKSLLCLAVRNSLNFGSLNDGLHVFWSQAPSFASQLFG